MAAVDVRQEARLTFVWDVKDQLKITTPAPPAPSVGGTVDTLFASEGGTPPLMWTATGLPEGVTLSPIGHLSGSPTKGGRYEITIIATESGA